MYERVWIAQAQKYTKSKRMNNDGEIENARRQWEHRQKKIIDEKINEKIKNAKAILKKMIENKKLMEKKVDKVKAVLQKMITSESNGNGKKNSKKPARGKRKKSKK